MSAEPEADTMLGAHAVGVLISPRTTFERLARQRSARPGASAIALLGIFWTTLLLLLWNAGHEPSAVLLPIPPAHYYLVEGLLITPVLTGLWWLSSEIAHRIARRCGGTGEEAGTRAALGFAYAVPMLVFHIVPELVAFAALGFSGVATVSRFTLPLASLLAWVLSARALRAAHGLAYKTAAFASFVGLFTQACAGALFIR